MRSEREREPWPDLPLASWRTTRDAIHLWSQLVGKTLLACAPVQSHWWHTALRVSARGLASARAYHRGRPFELELDLVDHLVRVRTEGAGASLALGSGSLRGFHARYIELLASLGLDARIWPVPVELPDPVPFERDQLHREYDRAWATRFLEVLGRCDEALKGVAAGYVGKQSPVHFFWGSFDLALTRFSGRRAPERPGADPVTREAYSHEVVSFGFWPGGLTPAGLHVDEPVFYAYAAPEPAGFRATEVPAARYDAALGEFLMPYAAVRSAADPAAAVRAFCERTYEAAASGGGWDRAALERGG